MKILHVITSLSTGGAEKLMVDLLPRLRTVNQETHPDILADTVELVVFDGKRTHFFDELEEAGIKIHVFGNNVYSISNAFKLIKFIHKFDIIHAHLSICQYYLAFARILAYNGAKLVTTEHNATNRRRHNLMFYILDKIVYSQYQKIVSIGDQTRQNLEKYIGMKHKMVTIYNGVDLTKIQNAKRSRTPDDGKVVITMVAAFRKQKDQETLIKAMTLLPDKYYLQLVGGGEYLEKVKHFAKQQEQMPEGKNMNGRVEFLGIRSDIPQIMKDSDILVLSSHWEGLSLSSIESMASGHPFVASDVDGLREIVNGYGILFPHQDYKQLAKIIEKLAEDSTYANEVANRCMEKANQYSIEKMASAYYRLYKELTRNNRQ